MKDGSLGGVNAAFGGASPLIIIALIFRLLVQMLMLHRRDAAPRDDAQVRAEVLQGLV